MTVSFDYELPSHPETESVQIRWAWYADLLDTMEKSVPAGLEPDVLTWSDPHESMEKERAERMAAESAVRSETVELIDLILNNGSVESPDERALFFASVRLCWAIDFSRRLSKLEPSEDCEGFHIAASNHHSALRWLLVGCYENFHSLPDKWWDQSSFENYY